MQLVAEAKRFAILGFRHRWKALVVAWLVCALGWAVVYSMPNTYQASARIYADADQVLGQALRGIAIDAQTSAQVEMLQRTLLSRPNLERVIARTDLDLRVTGESARESLVASLGRDIRIEPQTRTLFVIRYSDHDPQLARDVVATLLNLFIENAALNDRQQMENARNFITQQLAAYETQLREAERRRAEFRTRYLEILPSVELGGVSRLEAARSSLSQLQGQLQDLRVRRERTLQEIEAARAVPPPAAAGGGGGGRVAEEERRLRELLLRYTDSHPAVTAQRNLIAELRSSGGGGGGGGGAARPAAATGPTSLQEQLRVRLVDTEAEIASMERRIRETEAEITRLDAIARTAPQVQAEFMNLDRDYNVLLRQYEELLARRESLQVAGQARNTADRVRLEVVDPPTVPQNPSGPNRLLFASIVLVVGLGAGGGLALLMVLLDRGFYTIHDLRQLGLPVLGAISSVTPRARQALTVLVFLAALSTLLVTFGGLVGVGDRVAERLPGLIERLPELLASLRARIPV
jgi:polysaccharide chain length determinant protein (PEP-CTERM system associated)